MIRRDAGDIEGGSAMSDTVPNDRPVQKLLKRAERSRAEAERWFRFVKRFDESRRTAREPVAGRDDLEHTAVEPEPTKR